VFRSTASTNCDAAVNYNSGCGVVFNDTSTSYGAAFNQAGGGFFVTYRAKDSVKIWFFSRGDEDIPDVILNGPECDEPVYPDETWGAPDANFPFNPQYCDYDQHFNTHEMVFDLTFCVSFPVSSLLLSNLADTLVSSRATGLAMSGLLPAAGRGPAQTVRLSKNFQTPMFMLTDASLPQLSITTQSHFLSLTGKSIACGFTRLSSSSERGSIQFQCTITLCFCLFPDHL
jgi:hypothetical protein